MNVSGYRSLFFVFCLFSTFVDLPLASEESSNATEKHEPKTEEELLETEVRVVSNRFHEVEINLLVAGFIMAVVLAKICKSVRIT